VRRITLTMDERGFIHRICADEEIEVYIADPHALHDRVYRWSSTRIGADHVDEEPGDWPVGDKHHVAMWN
jgi:hypothetical protein